MLPVGLVLKEKPWIKRHFVVMTPLSVLGDLLPSIVVTDSCGITWLFDRMLTQLQFFDLYLRNAMLAIVGRFPHSQHWIVIPTYLIRSTEIAVRALSELLL